MITVNVVLLLVATLSVCYPQQPLPFLTMTFMSMTEVSNQYSDTFFMLAVTLRFIQGFGDAMAINAIYSAAAFEFRE